MLNYRYVKFYEVKMETQTLADVANGSSMSMWDMIWNSDFVTQVVMIGLILASVWSWAIIIDKVVTLRDVRRRSRSFES